MLRQLVHYSIALICLALAVRTFAAIGLFSPVLVQGSSMAPWARGERVVVGCPACGSRLKIGLDQLPADDQIQCPYCKAGRLTIKSATRLPADHLLVDRLSAAPKRWASVVFRTPNDTNTLAVKRVVGLPGEEVAFREGDLWINGERVVKPLDVQFEVRRLEHDERDGLRRWTPESGGWRWESGKWIGGCPEGGGPVVLRYSSPVFDDAPGNASLSRKFNLVGDLMIEVEPDSRQRAVWSLSLGATKATIDLKRRELSLEAPRHDDLKRCSMRRVPGSVCLTRFDRRPVLVVDGEMMLGLPTGPPALSSSASVSVLSGGVTLNALRVWKDVYYEPRPQAFGSQGDQPWRLGADGYFVVGDNQALSVDSRNWPVGPGVPGRLILGSALRVNGR